jgi:hypothetical protein
MRLEPQVCFSFFSSFTCNYYVRIDSALERNQPPPRTTINTNIMTNGARDAMRLEPQVCFFFFFIFLFLYYINYYVQIDFALETNRPPPRTMININTNIMMNGARDVSRLEPQVFFFSFYYINYYLWTDFGCGWQGALATEARETDVFTSRVSSFIFLLSSFSINHCSSLQNTRPSPNYT